jgi:hypothetical protein
MPSASLIRDALIGLMQRKGLGKKDITPKLEIPQEPIGYQPSQSLQELDDLLLRSNPLEDVLDEATDFGGEIIEPVVRKLKNPGFKKIDPKEELP